MTVSCVGRRAFSARARGLEVTRRLSGFSGEGYGLRYELVMPYTDANGHLANLDRKANHAREPNNNAQITPGARDVTPNRDAGTTTGSAPASPQTPASPPSDSSTSPSR